MAIHKTKAELEVEEQERVTAAAKRRAAARAASADKPSETVEGDLGVLPGAGDQVDKEIAGVSVSTDDLNFGTPQTVREEQAYARAAYLVQRSKDPAELHPELGYDPDAPAPARPADENDEAGWARYHKEMAAWEKARTAFLTMHEQPYRGTTSTPVSRSIDPDAPTLGATEEKP